MANMAFQDCEWGLIRGSLLSDNSGLSPEILKIARNLQDGDFQPVLSAGISGLHRETSEAGSTLNTLSSAILSSLQDSQNHELLFLMAVASVNAFLQSNVTGPPLDFDPARLIFGEVAEAALANVRNECIASLAVDGEAAYRLIPQPELFWLARTIVSGLEKSEKILTTPWWAARIQFLLQRMLDEGSASLEASIYKSLNETADILAKSDLHRDVSASFLLERSGVHIFHGYDVKARDDLEAAARIRGFKFALTGQLGKRTKFQENDTSQLVVLAKSADQDDSGKGVQVRPVDIKLDNDTLLESISFKKDQPASESTKISEEASIPQELNELDAADQPKLHPLDATILLQIASSVSEKAPASELTREETVPFATRVLQGGSPNWQVFTQALLVRSRIEGYRSRTMERGLLQLQAVADQIIAETAGQEATTSSFLPKASEEEAAPAKDRLRYVFQLSAPTRWEVETELAGRWASFGGLKTALEIYERLEKWVEAALCYAAVEQEKKGQRIIRKLLFEQKDADDEEWTGPERSPPPTDAPRLWCILGDISENDINCYQRSWEVSGNRYARAQRSIGRQYMRSGDYSKAAEAYAASLKINTLSFESWYALGCARLVLEDHNGAAEAFGRAVQLDDQDPESWSNLGTSLLRREHTATRTVRVRLEDEDDDYDVLDTEDDQTNRDRIDALRAFKKAVSLNSSLWRAWENVLTVAGLIQPPSLSDMILAMRRLIEIRGPSEGEKSVDIGVLEKLTRHIISTNEYSAELRGPPRLLIEFIDKSLTPIITTSPRLWRIVASLDLWRNKPSSALAAHEKAWRTLTTSWTGDGTEQLWNDIVEATLDLVDAYESLGPRERTEGLAAGSGELVAKDWKFKSRSAIRSVSGKAKDTWEGTDGWKRLKARGEELRS